MKQKVVVVAVGSFLLGAVLIGGMVYLLRAGRNALPRQESRIVEIPTDKKPKTPKQDRQDTLAAPTNIRAHNVSGRKTVDLGGGNSLSRFVSYIEVAWDPVAGAESYNLYWSQSHDLTKTTATLITEVASPYEHDVEIYNGELFYRVAAVKLGKESELSQEARTQAPSRFIRY